jgi:enamine deaminase RidA (YjgF/YER057c/UK114 family)
VAEVKLVNPPTLGPAIGFSHVAVANGWIFLSGQIGSGETGEVLAPGDLVAQFRRALQNTLGALEAAGGEPQGIVKLTYYVTDVSTYRANLERIGAAYREIMGKRYPASSLFEVSGLFDPKAMIEIECVAILDPLDTK